MEEREKTLRRCHKWCHLTCRVSPLTHGKGKRERGRGRRQTGKKGLAQIAKALLFMVTKINAIIITIVILLLYLVMLLNIACTVTKYSCLLALKQRM